MAFGYSVQGVAQMKTSNRATRAFEYRLPLGLTAGKHKTRAVMQVFQTPRDDAHHALMEIFIKHAQSCRRLLFLVHQRLGQQQCLLAHIAFKASALAVDGVELAGQARSEFGVVGAQAFNAQAHVRQTTSGVDARANSKTHVLAAGLRGVTPSHFEQGCQSRRHMATAHAQQALGDQAPIVGVE